MPVEVSEITRFAKGIVSSASETDIDTDFATFSLNVDSDVERGALRGIKGNYILGRNGWEIPRYAKWMIKVNVIAINQLTGSSNTSYTVTEASYNDSTTITHTASTDVHVGDIVSGDGIPTDAYVVSVTDTTHFELSVITEDGSKTNQTLNFKRMGKWWILNAFDKTFAVGFKDGTERFHQADLDSIDNSNLIKVVVNLAGSTGTAESIK